MKHLRKFDSVSEMNTALASATIDILALAYDNGTPVLKAKQGPNYSEPFYVENITQQDETLVIYMSPDYGSEYIVEYSINNINWVNLGCFEDREMAMELHPNDKIYLRTNSPYIGQADFRVRGISKIGGNIMSLMYGSNFTGNERTFPQREYPGNALYGVFSSNTHLIDASLLILPVTTLEEGCYQYMFGNCTALTVAPALPATTLAQECYEAMFSGCTSLTTAPVLPATTLADNCYQSMFQDCTALTTAPALPATTVALQCYSTMFYGCTSLTTAPSILPATTLAENCYGGMFRGCTELTTAPELPATTLAEYCYDLMFYDCTHLNYIKCLATDISASECTLSWLGNVAASGTFVKNPNMSSWTTGTYGIPSGWTVQDATA